MLSFPQWRWEEHVWKGPAGMCWEWGQFLSEVQGVLPQQEQKWAVFKADQRNQHTSWFKLKHMCSGNPLQAKQWGSFLGRQYIIFKENPEEKNLLSSGF